MVQVDLITGFLGAGKTTFLRRYVRYLVQQGHKVCILENDFGAVNVDAMLVQEVLGPGCDVETISGGCDCDTHQRRMRTKLIAMAMRGFDRALWMSHLQGTVNLISRDVVEALTLVSSGRLSQ